MFAEGGAEEGVDVPFAGPIDDGAADEGGADDADVDAGGGFQGFFVVQAFGIDPAEEAMDGGGVALTLEGRIVDGGEGGDGLDGAAHFAQGFYHRWAREGKGGGICRAEGAWYNGGSQGEFGYGWGSSGASPSRGTGFD